MNNVPDVKLGIVAVSRDCFPIELSQRRRSAVVQSCTAKGIDVVEINATVENETDVLKALDEIKAANVNALVVYLGNFGPEGPETMLAQKFNGPVMFAAAAEETENDLIGGRGDAYCGMLNASYSIGLRNLNPYIPEYPVGTAGEVADMMADFVDIARVVIGVSNLKIFGFGPRPYDFLACNAPIKPLYDLGVEVMENSELDLFESFNKHADDPRIPDVVKDMQQELGSGNNYPGILPKLAQYELTLKDWMDNHMGASKYAAFANKCWPAFQTQFGFVPCYVNSRLTGQGIPVACETDIYGALSEYVITCATQMPPTLLDINNTVPKDMYEHNKSKFEGYKPTDLFMGFHCGNTNKGCMVNASMRYQLIMHRTLEPDKEPDITRGTLEGTIRPGEITLFRLQGTADCQLRSYIAQGEVIDVDPKSFGGIGVFAVREMGRFYRHVLITKRYPHHAGIAFKHAGKVLFAAMKMLGVDDIGLNQPSTVLYEDENPFK
ncbi:L-fucose/L-arabinose isomerase family protein [Mahella australiensis]|uniref:L-fucose isomerase-like protein n=1 Tax=Mahella australiensis (strain DSM 15567 / CIP 107919 / 50-1 BON) TaxID=697281 RepID=F3ZW91_MAHA5|nr:fucose isomerase [Mahella australiensis]AEE97500.1 L-fucose isomerase-like protein [Mahella australiensis 50-1 BON]